jgi:hypothetical protein
MPYSRSKKLTIMRSSQIASRRLKELIEHENIHVSKHPSSLVTYGLLRKAFEIHKSVLILCREGLGSEAYALSRILIEIFIALRWITNDDQDNRAKEYGFFVAKRKEEGILGEDRHKILRCRCSVEVRDCAAAESFR